MPGAGFGGFGAKACRCLARTAEAAGRCAVGSRVVLFRCQLPIDQEESLWPLVACVSPRLYMTVIAFTSALVV